MQAGVVVTRARATLLDPNGVYWPDGELYDYLSAAQTAVVNLKPDAYAQTVFVSLVPGVLQAIPAEGTSSRSPLDSTTFALQGTCPSHGRHPKHSD